MITVHLGSTPSHQSHVALLDFLAARAPTFFVVDQFGLSETDNAFLRRAQPFLIEKQSVTQWPGTIRLDGPAVTLLRYRVTSGSLALLKEAADSLYGWLSWSDRPLPEDLGFTRADGRTLLTSVAHEQDAWLELEPDEYETWVALARQQSIPYWLRDSDQFEADQM
jgi:hypothetical protein